ncbi:AAA family ATPase [Mycobacterium sp. 3519A]|uniref:bifunctional aminoglycoside phosphotransferase/ATP-binding protein n=1 Tax=Mycobacterium sp. 3519A TaxID=2057184 RepID=UPI000C7C2305|nr:AAA family ATPase [Mycobacterium sp. 3519A]
MPATVSASDQAVATAGGLDAQVRETHTGLVFLVGDKVYKAKKAVVTDFLDFSTSAAREHACAKEVALNRRLAPDSYLGIAHFHGLGDEAAEPVVVMRRYPDDARLATLVTNGQPVHHHLCVIAEMLARFHEHATRGPAVNAEGTARAVSARWQQNLVELQRHAADIVPAEQVSEVARLATQFVSGRVSLFEHRIADRRVVDGHADLLADDVFCMPDGPALLDCLEFDDRLRYVDGVDDAAFLAMDLEFLGRKELGDYFLDEYARRADDHVPGTLRNFYIAYRAVVRAKVDCIRVAQGNPDARSDALRHIDIALDRMRAATVRLILIGGGPGTGKTTLSHGLAECIDAEVISTDDVRRELQHSGVISGQAGTLHDGLYTPENVAIVYDEVLRRARQSLANGRSTILDGTWRDSRQRDRARELARAMAASISEFTCSVPTSVASERIEKRPTSTSDATPQIAVALVDPETAASEGIHIDTSRPLSESVAEAQRHVAW